MIDPTKPLGVTDIAACVTVERAFLATLLEAPHRVGDCLLWGASSLWFTDPTCARVWSAVEALTAQSIPCDLALVEATVSDFRNASPAARDFAHVSELVRFGMNPCYLKHYASTLRRFAAERQAAGIAHGILSNPNDATSAEDYAASVTHGAGLLLNVAGSVLAEEATDPASRVQRAAADALGASQRKPGIRTGISGIDFMLRGIRAGENLVVGARPGVGKSAFAVTVCLNVMHADPEAAIFYASAEMPVGEVLKRMLSGMSNVSVEAIENGTASPEDRAAWSEAAIELERCAPLIEARGMSNPAQVFATAQAFKVRRQRLDLIVVDHIHRMVAKGTNRTEQLTHISGAIARMAADLECPVIALAQLNRGIETREDKTPTLADLRDSGSIEQDADFVIFLHRPGATGIAGTDPTQAEAFVAKNRRGQTGKAALKFRPETTRFYTLEPADRAEKFTL